MIRRPVRAGIALALIVAVTIVWAGLIVWALVEVVTTVWEATVDGTVPWWFVVAWLLALVSVGVSLRAQRADW